MDGTRLPRLLSIAGSDSSGGAGIQADLKTFCAHGGYAMTAITAITAQNTLGVTAVQVLPPALVAAQIEAVFADPGVDAIKVGMLAEGAIIDAVADCLFAAVDVPTVIDPVMISKSGARLLDAEAVGHLERLFPLATLLTPNLPEAEQIDCWGASAGSVASNGSDGSDSSDSSDGSGGSRAEASLEGRERLVRRLGERCAAVLLKGGHAEGDEVVDLLWDGFKVHSFVHPRVVSRSTHGTGCSLSSAIAARLGRGESLIAAVSGGIDWLHEAIRRAIPIGAGTGPVDHFWRLRREEVTRPEDRGLA